MQTFVVALHDQEVTLVCPDSVADDIDFLFRPHVLDNPSAGERRTITIAEDARGRYSIVGAAGPAHAGLTRDDLMTFVMDATVHALVDRLAGAVALHAGMVARGADAVLIAGGTGAGKSSLVAWLGDNGFVYVTDEIALLTDGKGSLAGFSRALVVKPGAADAIKAMRSYAGGRMVPSGTHVLLRPQADGCHSATTCRLIVFPEFQAGADIGVEVVGSARAGLRLMGCNLNARNLDDGGFRMVSGLARRVPAVALRYGHFDQLDGVLDRLISHVIEGRLDPARDRRLLSAFSPAPPTPAPVAVATPVRFEVPQATPRGPACKLTIGMATYDDYDGVYFSLQALRLYHREVADAAEFLVVDNHPNGPCAQALKRLEAHVPHYRYIPCGERSGTAVRDVVFAQAAGEFVLCMDCHVLIQGGALQRLMAYLGARPGIRDLLQGPLVYDGLNTIATHFEPAWREGMYGYWQTDPRGLDPDGPAFDIPMQGLGLFACRRDAWPGFHPEFRGFGGEEGYIHEKFRRNGGRTLCLPFLRWLHRFERPMGVPYPNRWEDRIHNYLVGARELGQPTAGIERHFREHLGEGAAADLFARLSGAAVTDDAEARPGQGR